jgi:hypothetical protein
MARFFQVLSLPEKVVLPARPPLKNQEDMEQHDPATIHQLLSDSLGGTHD